MRAPVGERPRRLRLDPRRAVRNFCALAIAGLCVAALGAASAAASAPVADLSLSGRSIAVPPSFLGLSFEYREMNSFEIGGPLFDRMLALLRPQDDSPLVVRLGGRSADEAYWDLPNNVKAPKWVYQLGPAWLTQLAQLAVRDHLHMEFDLNLAVHSPRMAVSFARAAAAALPNDQLAGFAIGNEPDLYRLQPGLEKERIPSTIRSEPLHWTDGYTPLSYRSDYRTYAKALLKALPGVPITAPEITFPSVDWLSDLLGLGSLAPTATSVHRYATATCKRKKVHGAAPTVLSFLENRYTHGLAMTLGNNVAYAKSHGVGLRVTEMNSVTCGGHVGIANSFATALWAPDALFEMMREGVQGINWHIRSRLANAPFRLTPVGVLALPEMYGLTLFQRMLGRHDQLELVNSSLPQGTALKAWAVQSRRGLKVLLINKGDAALVARLHMGSGRPARVARLLAPGVGSESGVTLAGQSIDPEGRWQGTRRATQVTARSGVYDVRVPAYSAALVNLGRP
jgi:Glycosyl hydrolase family 79 C-terminal beta domain